MVPINMIGLTLLIVIASAQALITGGKIETIDEPSKKALDQVGSYLLKRAAAVSASDDDFLGANEGDRSDLTGGRGSDEARASEDQQGHVEKRPLDFVGSYLLRKRFRPVDTVGSYLLKRRVPSSGDSSRNVLND